MTDEETKNFGRCLIKKGERNYKTFIKEVKEILKSIGIIAGLAVILIIGIYLITLIADYILKQSSALFVGVVLTFFAIEACISIIAIIDEMKYFYGYSIKRYINAMLNIHISFIQFCWLLFIMATSIIPVFMLLAILTRVFTNSLWVILGVTIIGGILLSPLNFTLWQCLNCETYVDNYKPDRVQYWK